MYHFPVKSALKASIEFIDVLRCFWTPDLLVSGWREMSHLYMTKGVSKLSVKFLETECDSTNIFQSFLFRIIYYFMITFQEISWCSYANTVLYKNEKKSLIYVKSSNNLSNHLKSIIDCNDLKRNDIQLIWTGSQVILFT